MKILLTLAAFTPISFIVFVLIEEFFLGVVINFLLLLSLHTFFEKWLQAIKKTEC